MIGPQTVIELPSRAERLDALRAIIGRPDPDAAIVPERIWTILERHYEKVVGPLIDRSWPHSEGDENRRRFLRKAQFIAHTYASSSYVPVALGLASPFRRLPIAGPLQRVALGVPLRIAEPLVLRTVAAMLPAYVAAAPIDARLVALLAGLCTAYDQSFDDWPGDLDPVVRHAHIERMWRWPAEEPRLTEPGSAALTRALLVEIKASLDEPYDELVELGCAASAAEMRSALGLPDPDALSHRRAAAEATADAMIIQSRPVDPAIRDWLHEFAVFAQLTDDWVDVETDVLLRETPVLTGSVGLPELQSRWRRLLDRVRTMLWACGIYERRTVELAQDGVRYVMWAGIDGMEHRVAD